MHDGESSVIVVAGGYGMLSSESVSSTAAQLNSVEILNPSSGQWTMGKKSHIKSKYLGPISPKVGISSKEICLMDGIQNCKKKQ